MNNESAEFYSRSYEQQLRRLKETDYIPGDFVDFSARQILDEAIKLYEDGDPLYENLQTISFNKFSVHGHSLETPVIYPEGNMPGAVRAELGWIRDVIYQDLNGTDRAQQRIAELQAILGYDPENTTYYSHVINYLQGHKIGIEMLFKSHEQVIALPFLIFFDKGLKRKEKQSPHNYSPDLHTITCDIFYEIEHIKNATTEQQENMRNNLGEQYLEEVFYTVGIEMVAYARYYLDHSKELADLNPEVARAYIDHNACIASLNGLILRFGGYENIPAGILESQLARIEYWANEISHLKAK